MYSTGVGVSVVVGAASAGSPLAGSLPLAAARMAQERTEKNVVSFILSGWRCGVGGFARVCASECVGVIGRRQYEVERVDCDAGT